MKNSRLLLKKLWGIVLLAGIIVLPGCKRPHYTPRPFESITPYFSGEQTHAQVTVKVAPLSKQESLNLFDQRGDRLHGKRKPLRPVLVTIHNESEKTYTFNPKTMEIKLGNPRAAARRMYGHTSRRIIAPLLLGSLGATVCFFGAAYLVILGTIQQVAMPALVKAGYSLLGISGLIAVSAPTVSYYHGSQSYTINKKIDHDVAQKAAHCSIEVAPHSSASFLLFCQNRALPMQWTIILNEKETQQPLIFDVQLSKKGVSHA